MSSLSASSCPLCSPHLLIVSLSFLISSSSSLLVSRCCHYHLHLVVISSWFPRHRFSFVIVSSFHHSHLFVILLISSSLVYHHCLHHLFDVFLILPSSSQHSCLLLSSSSHLCLPCLILIALLISFDVLLLVPHLIIIRPVGILLLSLLPSYGHHFAMITASLFVVISSLCLCHLFIIFLNSSSLVYHHHLHQLFDVFFIWKVAQGWGTVDSWDSITWLGMDNHSHKHCNFTPCFKIWACIEKKKKREQHIKWGENSRITLHL